MYVLCGCDIVDAMKGITHNTGMSVLVRFCKETRTPDEKKMLDELNALGTRESVTEDSIAVLEHFTCKLYKSPEKTLDGARCQKWEGMKYNAKMLMITSHSFHYRCLRAFYPVRTHHDIVTHDSGHTGGV